MIKTAELKMLPLSVLKPAAYNPRKKLKPGDKEYQKIKNSIEEFGFADPLVVNADMTIIGGHQRFNVAVELGITEVPCAVVDVDKVRLLRAVRQGDVPVQVDARPDQVCIGRYHPGGLELVNIVGVQDAVRRSQAFRDLPERPGNPTGLLCVQPGRNGAHGDENQEYFSHWIAEGRM